MAKVKVKVEQELELDWESTQEIVVASLKEDFDTLTNEIVSLRMKSHLENYQKEDLMASIKYRDAVYNLLQYYMVHTDFEMFMRNRSSL